MVKNLRGMHAFENSKTNFEIPLKSAEETAPPTKEIRSDSIRNLLEENHGEPHET